MLINRALAIAALMIVGLVVLSVGTWMLAFNTASSNIHAWSFHWMLQRLPMLIGLLLVIAGFRLLSATRVSRPVLSDSDPAP